MIGLAIDTLAVAKGLKGAGFSETQAETVFDILADVQKAQLAELATKADVLEVRTEVSSLRAELKADLRELELRIAIKLGAMIVVAVGVLAAQTRFLPSMPH
jgi:hypothetical protein